ncbi:hypothetical protein Cgig2_011606 [Carnegiea gigantea]|uniref:DUF4283 domain-containing protein n=1 Tax=Carnegiea gigantea TaxID=171969 RepID=A0A9Q1GLH4_9CARY|nr:hypothetical protein Cgig2_011606 [Carnegiea gigantea]
MGKLFTKTFYNVGAMKSLLRNTWKPTKGIITREVDKNLFSYQFFSESNMKLAFNGGPWPFNGCTLLLKEINRMEQLSKINFGLLVGVDRSIKFQVDVDVSKPLKRGIWVKFEGKWIWITLRYVIFADFCYTCGRLGHTYKGYELFDEDVPETELQYGLN